MKRRTFVRAAAISALSTQLGSEEAVAAVARSTEGPTGQGHRSDPRALIMDAMGELRPIYEPSLVREMLASGIDSITVTLCDPKPVGAEALELAIDGLLEYDAYLASHPDLFIKATSVADVEAARASGRMAVFYLYQNSIQFADSFDRVDMFYGLGLRSSQITYNERNLAGVGCREEGDDGGLTGFGRDLVGHMNGIGMLIDLSHANMPTMADTIRQSAQPVVISHTACNDLYAHERNTTDENLRLLADHGGVVGVCQLRPFLTSKKSDNLHTYFDHIDHAVNVAGLEAVAIGSDRDHRVIEMTPEYEAELRAEEGSQVTNSELPYFIDELNGPRRMEVVWDGLVGRGYSEDEVERIMGWNLFRLYSDVIG
jgi:membrane dipeptidase